MLPSPQVVVSVALRHLHVHSKQRRQPLDLQDFFFRSVSDHASAVHQHHPLNLGNNVGEFVGLETIAVPEIQRVVLTAGARRAGRILQALRWRNAFYTAVSAERATVRGLLCFRR